MPPKKVPITYTLRQATETDREIFTGMVQNLYQEDKRPEIDPLHCQKTLAEFSRYPNKGCIYLIEQEKQVIGYIILVVFWANEFGGNIVTIDELFLLPEYRNQGIGTELIQNLQKDRPYNAVGLYLVTSPENTSAQNLYQRLGFKPYKDLAFLYEY